MPHKLNVGKKRREGDGIKPLDLKRVTLILTPPSKRSRVCFGGQSYGLGERRLTFFSQTPSVKAQLVAL